jgi:hypothetical protein
MTYSGKYGKRGLNSDWITLEMNPARPILMV